MKKSLLLATIGLLASTLSIGAYAGDKEHCDYHKKGSYMTKVDTNEDGAVSREEYIANAEARFAELDANGDGVIQKEEFKKKHKDMKEKRMEMKKSKESAE